jgi:hypothetical protein
VPLARCHIQLLAAPKGSHWIWLSGGLAVPLRWAPARWR